MRLHPKGAAATASLLAATQLRDLANAKQNAFDSSWRLSSGREKQRKKLMELRSDSRHMLESSQSFETPFVHADVRRFAEVEGNRFGSPERSVNGGTTRKGKVLGCLDYVRIGRW